MKTTARLSILSLALAAVTFIAALSAQATLLVYEGFNYTSGTSLTNASATAPDVGSGWSGPWGNSGGGVGAATNLSDSLGYTDFFGQTMYTTGGKAAFGVTNGTTANNNIARAMAIGSLVSAGGNIHNGMSATAGATTNVFWFSMLSRFTNANGFQSTTQLFARKANITFRLNATTNGPGGTAGSTGVGDALDFGIPNRSTYTNVPGYDKWTVWRAGDPGSSLAATNNPLFGGLTTKALTNLSWVLMRMEINGLLDTNDVVYTWINWTNLNAEPPLGSADRTNVAHLTSNNCVRIELNGGNSAGTNAAVFADEIRVGTSFADAAGLDPYVTTQPTSLPAAPNGGTAIFTVAATTSFGPLTYLWYSNGVAMADGGNVSGATTASLNITPLSAADNGVYTCAITNTQPQGTVSSAATLNVVDPGIATQPTSLTRTNGDTAVFSVVAGGTTPFSYQWTKNGADIAGATDSDLTLTLVSYLDTASYAVVITNTGVNMSITSSVATLTVRDPWIISQPASLIRAKGQAGSMTAVVTSSVPASLVYRWRNGTTELVDGGDRTGAATATLSFASCDNSNAISANIDYNLNSSYNVVVSNNATAPAQTIGSANATLTVVAAPPNRTVAAGLASVTFMAIMNGSNATSAMTYQWYANGVAITDATNRIYYHSNTVAGFSASYSVDSTDATGTVSGTGVLSVVVGNVILYPTNLVIVRGGEGTENASSSSGCSAFLDQYTTNGVYVSTVTLPNSGATQFAINAISSTSSFLSRSMDGRLLTIAGYDTNSANFGIGSGAGGLGLNTLAAQFPRVIATINGLGEYNRPFKSTTLYGSTDFRGATTDGTNNFWASAGNTGITYLTPPGTSVTVQSGKSNLRSTHIFNGDLYFTAASTAGDAKQGVYRVNAGGRPTVDTALIGGWTNVGDFLTISGANDFAVDSTSTTIYCADGGSHIRKYTNNAGVYTLAYTLTNFPYMLPGSGPRYMTVDFSGTDPVIYTVAGTQGSSGHQNRLYKLTDTGASSAFIFVTQAGQGQLFKGIRFAPDSIPAAIATNPTTITNCAGTEATFTVSATGTSPLLYQWRKGGVDLTNGGNVSGATSSSLTLSGVTQADAASYEVVVTGFGSVTSAPPAELDVVDPPLITVDPNGASLADGDTTNLTVTATSETPITSYQWRKGGVDLTDGGQISGATTDSLTISGANAGNSGGYDVVVANSCGNSTSATAVVTVDCPTITLAPPSLPSTPQFNIYSQTVSASGGSASPYTFAVTVGALPAGLTLASGGGISGAATAFGTNDFTIEATDTNGCTGSNAYTIIVTPATIDTNLPTVTISTPANNSGHTATPVAFTGTAADPGAGASGVLEVRFGVNGGPTNAVATGTTAWTASVPVDPGTNTVAFVSKDNQGNESLGKTRKVFLSVPGIFSLGTNVAAPYGFIKTYTVTGDTTTTNGAPLKIGRAYTVEAYPAAVSNHLFTNWTVVVNGGSPTVVTNLKYTFLMNSNVSLTANFITNNFIGAAGFYYGLFNDVGVAHQSAGWFKIKTDSKQKFSGKILVQGEVVAVSGTFNQSGHGVLKPGKVFARKGLTNAPIVVELDLALDGSDVLTGTVSNNVEGWNSTLLGDRGTFAYITAPATNYMIGGTTGQFTFVYAGSLTAATEPGGDGYALVTLKSNGFVTPTGGRAGDYQLRKSTTTSISKNGQWPFYAPMYKYSAARTSPAFTAKTYRGSVFGWLTFTNNTVIGDLYWNKIDWTNGIYNSGFTNTETIIGSGYIKPPSLTPVFADTNGTTMLADGNIPASPLINDWTLSSNNKLFFTNAVPPINTNGIKGSVATGKGEVSVTFTNPATPLSKTTAKGVVLQDINEIRGVFVGTNQTGSIRLTP